MKVIIKKFKHRVMFENNIVFKKKQNKSTLSKKPFNYSRIQ